MVQTLEDLQLTPVADSTAFGIDYHHFEGPSGIRLKLSEHGAEMLNEPDFQTLLADSIHAVAMQTDGGLPPIPDGADIHKVADPNGRARNMSTIYGLSGFIVKAGLDRQEGTIQFGTMNWLHGVLPAFSDRITAPAQYALISSPANLPTTIMAQAAGISLNEATHSFFGRVPREHAQDIRQETVREVKSTLVAAIGHNAYDALMNDIDQHGHVGNIIVDGTPGSADARLTVIDQPSFTKLTDRIRIPRAYDKLRRQYSRSKAA